LDASAFGSRDVISEGRVPRILGMNAYESLILPTNSISLAAMAVHPNAAAIAVRALEPQAPSEYLAATVVNDPQSGLTLGYRRHYNPSSGKHYVSFECVFGCSRAITGAPGQRRGFSFVRLTAAHPPRWRNKARASKSRFASSSATNPNGLTVA
jgi:hypothetical protein